MQQQSSYCTKPLTFWGLFSQQPVLPQQVQDRGELPLGAKLTRPRFVAAEDVQGTEAFLLQNLPQAVDPLFLQSSQQLLGYLFFYQQPKNIYIFNV